MKYWEEKDSRQRVIYQMEVEKFCTHSQRKIQIANLGKKNREIQKAH